MIGAKVVVFVCVGRETILRGEAACTSVSVYLGSQWEDAKGNQRVCEWGGANTNTHEQAQINICVSVLFFFWRLDSLQV